MTTSSSPRSFQALHGQLCRDGLPVNYVERIIGELADHQSDLDQSNAIRASRRQLGPTDVLRTSIVEGYRAQTFAGRHPILAFVVGSLLIAPICCIGYAVLTVFGLTVAGALLGAEDVHDIVSTTLAIIGLETTLRLGGILVYLGAAAAMASLVRRSGSGARWLLAATCVQCLVALLTTLSFELSTIPGQSHVLFGTPPDAELEAGWPLVTRIVAQVFMPLVVGLLVWKRMSTIQPLADPS